MMGFKERAFVPLVAVSLEELVPQDHFYRHLQKVLDHAGRLRFGSRVLRSRWTTIH
jgi:hypothetical protein